MMLLNVLCELAAASRTKISSNHKYVLISITSRNCSGRVNVVSVISGETACWEKGQNLLIH